MGSPSADCSVAMIGLSGKNGSGLFARIDQRWEREVRQYTWNGKKSSARTGCMYATAAINKRQTELQNYVWGLLVACGERQPKPVGYVIDHIDLDGLNNTAANLRAVTRSANSQNRAKMVVKKSTKTASAYNGVSQCFNYSPRQTPDGPFLWQAQYKGALLGVHSSQIVCAFWYDNGVKNDPDLGCTKMNFTYCQLHNLYPLSERALENLHYVLTTPKYANAAPNITHNLRAGTFTVVVCGVCVGTFPSLDEAVIFRDMAKPSKQAAEDAKKQAQEIYYQDLRKFGSEEETKIFRELVLTKGAKEAWTIHNEVYRPEMAQWIKDALTWSEPQFKGPHNPPPSPTTALRLEIQEEEEEEEAMDQMQPQY